LNATFGNSVETLISVVALLKAKEALASGNEGQAHFFLTLIQTSLLGSMLSNLLLVQGSAFFLGGLRHPMQSFSRDGAVTSAGLLVLATLALGVPTMLWKQADQATQIEQQLGLSRFVSICLLVIYLCFLLFQLRTHRFLFEKASEIHKAQLEFEAVPNGLMNIIPIPTVSVLKKSEGNKIASSEEESFQDVELTTVSLNEDTTKTAPQVLRSKEEEQDILGRDEEQDPTNHKNNNRVTKPKNGSSLSKDLLGEDVTKVPSPTAKSKELPQMKPLNSSSPRPATTLPSSHQQHEAQIGFFFALLYLVISTVAVAFVSHVVVDAAEGAVESIHLNPSFIGGVVVPIVGNAAEHASALMFAWRDKMDTALAIAVGSAIQIPLFVLPVCILTGWAIEVPLTLNLDQFMMTIVVVTSLALAFTLHAGSSHWLHGLILIFEYLIIAAAFWFK